MRKSILFLLTLISLNTSFGQLTKGNLLVGGGGTFYSFKENNNTSTYDYKYKQIDLSPNIGYFVADKLAFGLRPTFSSIKGGYFATGGSISTNVQRYWIGPFGRYYFLPTEKEFNILTDLSYQWGFFGGGLEGKLNTFSALAGPVIYFNSSVGLEFLLGYHSSLEDATNGIKLSRKGFQFSVGFQIHLEK